MTEHAKPDPTEPSSAGITPPDVDRAARRARMLANLDVALGLAEQLGQVMAKTFPEAAAKVRIAVDPTLSVDERIRLGDAATCELTAIAMHLAPEATLDSLEANLEGDRDSEREAAALISKMKAGTR